MVRNHRLKVFFIAVIIITVFIFWGVFGLAGKHGFFNRYPDGMVNPVDRVDYSDMNN